MPYYQLVLLSLMLVNIYNCSNGYRSRVEDSLRRVSRNNDFGKDQDKVKPNVKHLSDEAIRTKIYQALSKDLLQLINKNNLKNSEGNEKDLTLGDVKANVRGNPIENDPSVSKFYTFTKYAIDHPKPFTWTDVLTAQLLGLLSGTQKINKDQITQLNNNCKCHKDLILIKRPGEYNRLYDRTLSCLPRLYEELNSELFKHIREGNANINIPNLGNGDIKDKLIASCSSDLNSDYFARQNNIYKKILLEGLTKGNMSENISKSQWPNKGINLLNQVKKTLPAKNHDFTFNNKIHYLLSNNQTEGKNSAPNIGFYNKTNLESQTLYNSATTSNLSTNPDSTESLNDLSRNSYSWKSHTGYKLPTENTYVNFTNEIGNNSQSDSVLNFKDNQNKFFVKLPLLNCMNKTLNSSNETSKQTFNNAHCMNKQSNYNILRDFTENLENNSNKSIVNLKTVNTKNNYSENYQNNDVSMNTINKLNDKGNIGKTLKNITSDLATSVDLYKNLPAIIKYAFTVGNVEECSNPKLTRLLSSVAGDFMPLKDNNINNDITHRCKSFKFLTTESKKNTIADSLKKEVKHKIILPEYEKMDNVTFPDNDKKKQDKNANESSVETNRPSLTSDSRHWLAKLPLMEFLCQLMSSNSENDDKLTDRLFNDKLVEDPTTPVSGYSDEGYLVIPLSNINVFKGNSRNNGNKKRKHIKQLGLNPEKCFSHLSNNLLQMIFLNTLMKDLTNGPKRVKKSVNNITNEYYDNIKVVEPPQLLKDDLLMSLKQMKPASNNSAVLTSNSTLFTNSSNQLKTSCNKTNPVMSLTESALNIGVKPNIEPNVINNNQTRELINSSSALTQQVTANNTLSINETQNNSSTPRYNLRKKLLGITANIDSRITENERVSSIDNKTIQQERISNIFISQNQSQKGSVAINISPDHQQIGPASVSINSCNPVNTSINHNPQLSRSGLISSPNTSSITINHPQNLMNPISINVSNVPLMENNNQHICINISHIQPNQLMTKINESFAISMAHP